MILYAELNIKSPLRHIDRLNVGRLEHEIGSRLDLLTAGLNVDRKMTELRDMIWKLARENNEERNSRARSLANRVLRGKIRSHSIEERTRKFFEAAERKGPKMETDTWRYVMQNLAPQKKVQVVTSICLGDGYTNYEPEMWDMVSAWGAEKWDANEREQIENNHEIEALRMHWWAIDYKELYAVVANFPKKTSYGADLILPTWLSIDKEKEPDKYAFTRALLKYFIRNTRNGTLPDNWL
mmetsp:Transcript_13435/g.15594  ORF Transcript_13435/g.15594 Transcript_13435/m.15594 type:complete len:239 (+) Transcript_13435:2138-2854(+)